ncbi:helix-turn-helix transcriptional regulator [Lentzea fradiae]|uniref:helix-turn-helix transcriptional regulator n=1 Tax=Lentzea fradiae TaxID=200378 RepID=UPI00115FC5E4|nr:helix-turn-helix transcriptional regulator [Lentzea fradiae]
MASSVESARRLFADSEAARTLCEELAADRRTARVVTVSGPGGTGKSTLLALLSSITDDAVFVDDAHELGEAEMTRLARLAGDRDTTLVVAHRPWPVVAGLNSLPLTQHPVLLEPLSRAATAHRIAEHVRTSPPHALVDDVWRRTGGIPSLVIPVAEALRDGDRVPADVMDEVHRMAGRVPAPALRVLAAVALGCPPGLLTAVLGVPSPEAAVECARATGLLTADGTLVELAREAVLDRLPVAQRWDVEDRLALTRPARRGPVGDAVRAGGVPGHDLAGVLRLPVNGADGSADAVGLPVDGVSGHDPANVVRLPVAGQGPAGGVSGLGSANVVTLPVNGASGSPADAVTLDARRAEEAVLAGDLDAALALAEPALEHPDVPTRALAAAVSATALAHRGMAAESAALYQWPEPSASAVPLLVGLGRLAEAELVTGAAVADHPTVDGAVRDLMARGVLDSVTGSPVSALSELLRAAALLGQGGRTALLPDTPAALAALVAVHLGELDIAAAVLSGANAGLGEQKRHVLLLSWISMVRGEFERAGAGLREVGPGPLADPRDELFAAAIEIGIARRLGAHAGVAEAWPRARDAVMRYPVDLYVLLPIGEIAVAAARLHADTWTAPHLEGAEELLERIGHPPLWSAPLHWYGTLAAIAADSPARAAHHASVLRKAAGCGIPLAETLAEAAHCWLRVLGGDVDPRAVEHAARGLNAAGLVWEAAQLAGEAAIRTPDRRTMTALLTCARSLRERTKEPAPGGKPDAGLSRREVEVAELLLAGMTHREIGEKLFISAKTVEHHVARIRRRIGAGNRADLLAQLKVCLAARNDDQLSRR